MIKKIYYAITGDPNEKVLKKYRPIVQEINDLEPEFADKNDDELRGMTVDAVADLTSRNFSALFRV